MIIKGNDTEGISKLNKSFIVAVLLIAMACAALAAMPQTINYQGYLKNNDGTPVTGPLTIAFSLYSTTSGTGAMWTENQSVTAASGIYSARLGQINRLTLPFDRQYYLGVKVGSDPEMTPRQQLTAAPYAMRSGCNPGDMVACFTGDITTMNNGLCKTGIRTCNPDGSGFGACIGEVVPNCGNQCLNLANDLNNCGACGNVCAAPNGTPGCVAGACGITSCNPNYGNCDGNTANGCETSLLTAANCGACGNVCASGFCPAGTCKACAPGQSRSCYTGPPGTIGV